MLEPSRPRGPPSPAFQPSNFSALAMTVLDAPASFFFSPLTSLCPATGCLANSFSQHVKLQMIDQNTNLIYPEAKTMRKKRFMALFTPWAHEKNTEDHFQSRPIPR